MTENDSYPMPLQTDITEAVTGYRFLSTVNATGYFHQFLVQLAHRHKLTVVSHRGQEQYNVALMGYKGSPPYVQRQTEHPSENWRLLLLLLMNDEEKNGWHYP